MKKLILIFALALAPLAHAMEPVEVTETMPGKESPKPAVATEPGVPALKQLSVQDLINSRTLPRLHNGQLNLAKKGLTSLIGLENVPNPEQVTGLFLDDNNIAFIPDNALDRFINLNTILMTDNPLIRIQPHLFDNCFNLEELHLEYTSLVEIPSKSFDSLRKLKILHLFGNKLESLPDGIIDPLINLEEFDIANNKLTQLDPDLLRNQTEKLERLRFSHNNLARLPHVVHLTKLKELHIAKNREITELPGDVIAFIREHKIGFDMPELLGEIPEYSVAQLIAALGEDWENRLVVADPDTGDLMLKLDNQGLTDLTGLPGTLGTLQIFKISAKNNFITKIPNEFFVQLLETEEGPRMTYIFPYLETLDLSNNLIQELPVLPYPLNKCCPYLADIDLSGNQITRIPIFFNGLRHLYQLDLRDNQIGSIADGAFNGLGVLEFLFLGHNKLHVLTKTLFKNLYKLQDLDLTHNNLGNKEQYIFPPKALVRFYPQEYPMLKLLAAKRIAQGFETQSLLQVIKTVQYMPDDLRVALLPAASKNAALKLNNALVTLTLLNALLQIEALAQQEGLQPQEIQMQFYVGGQMHSQLAKPSDQLKALISVLVGTRKDIQQALLALAPDSLRAKLIEGGVGLTPQPPTSSMPSQREVEAEKKLEQAELREELANQALEQAMLREKIANLEMLPYLEEQLARLEKSKMVLKKLLEEAEDADEREKFLNALQEAEDLEADLVKQLQDLRVAEESEEESEKEFEFPEEEEEEPEE